MRNLALTVAALFSAAPALGAERNFSVTSFDRIRVEGGYSVTLATGVAPYARAKGSAQALDSLSIDVQGRTLVIRPSRSSWGGYPGQNAGPVEIRIGTHDLSAAWVNGAGSLAIDKVKGLSFQSDVQGSGSIAIGRVDADQVKLGLAGAASARLAGKAGKMTAIIRGSSQLEAEGLSVKDLNLAAEGPAIATVTATATAKVNGAGAATIAIAGDPACTVKVTGSASVAGCK